MIKDFMANAVPIGAHKNATIETKFTQKKCKKVRKKNDPLFFDGLV